MLHIATSDVIFFIGSFLTLLALFSHDMLMLQSLYLISSLLFVGFAIAFKLPMMILFNIGYILVNVYQIIKIFIARSTILIPAHLKTLYKKSFSSMTPREFLAFIELGSIETLPAQDYLCREGDLKDYLLLLLQGTTTVQKNNEVIAKLEGFHFVGEMRFLTHHPMSADVKAESKVSYIRWDFNTLTLLKIRKPTTYSKFLEILASDLVEKISNRQIILH